MTNITVSIVDRPVEEYIAFPSDVFSVLKRVEWFQHPLVQEWIKAIDEAELIDGFCFRDRWGQVIPPEYLSSGSKTLCLILFQDIPVLSTRFGDNCVPYVERIAELKPVHLVVQNCVNFSKNVMLHITDTNTDVQGGLPWFRFYNHYKLSLRGKPLPYERNN